MKEKFELNLYSYWLMMVNCSIYGFLIPAVIMFLATFYAFYLWWYKGQSVETSGVLFVPFLALVMMLVCLIGLIFKKKLKEGGIKCKQRELVLEDDYFVYKDKDGNEHTLYWQDINLVKLMAIKMGYKATICSPQLTFVFFSYEVDPIPESFKEQAKMKTLESEDFFHILKILKDKAPHVEFKKDFFTRQLKLPV